MSLASKIKEVILCVRAGKVTLPYPFKPRPTADGFRGRPIFDAMKCIGCGGCANNCPAREILIFDPKQEIRVIKYLGRRCTYCGRCADVCPEKAITMDLDFETATNHIEDLSQTIEVFMGNCQRCGRCFKDVAPIDDLMMKGFRSDDLGADRWVYQSSPYLDRDPSSRDIEIEVEGSE